MYSEDIRLRYGRKETATSFRIFAGPFVDGLMGVFEQIDRMRGTIRHDAARTLDGSQLGDTRSPNDAA
jgi:hypothetical protein